MRLVVPYALPIPSAVIDALAATEEHIDAQIRAEEERKSAIKAERERLERERVAALLANIDTMRGYVAQCRGKTAAQIATALATIEGLATPDMQEFAERFAMARSETLTEITALQALAAKAEADLAEQRRIADEQAAEAARLHAVAAQQRAEAQRLKAERAELEQARLAAEKLAQQAAPVPQTAIPEPPAAPPVAAAPAIATVVPAPAPHAPGPVSMLEQDSAALPWPSPSERDLEDPLFDAIWKVIKSWDISVPGYEGAGYCSGNGSHVMLILNALRRVLP